MERYIGLMSGTSRDSVDAVLIELQALDQVRVTGHCQLDYPEPLAHELELAATADGLGYQALGTLDARVGLHFARAACNLLEQAGLQPGDIRALGSHGQTIHHSPGSHPSFSWQIGDPFRIAEATGIDTVAQFRQRDIAAGGQGAPLASAFHAACLGHPERSRAILNIGGISNLTWLQPGDPVIGFDCGPGNTLMDAWSREHLGAAFDQEGAWARAGSPSPELLARLSCDPFFRLPPPRSTGPEYFSPRWLRERGGEVLDRLSTCDVQATLLELTLAGIRSSLEILDASPQDLLVCGGGAHNAYLMERLAQTFPESVVEPTDRHGLPAQQVEGAAFAWLAARALAHRSGNLPEVTGALGPRILGCLIPGDLPAGSGDRGPGKR
ncbi:MAG: anhydro-N-acetylmuramic acid kinase [Pseudomonadota bacterium]